MSKQQGDLFPTKDYIHCPKCGGRIEHDIRTGELIGGCECDDPEGDLGDTAASDFAYDAWRERQFFRR